jgi:hypothetical protein
MSRVFSKKKESVLKSAFSFPPTLGMKKKLVFFTRFWRVLEKREPYLALLRARYGP